MGKAIAKVGDVVIADSDNTVLVEGNHYFPKSDVKTEYLTESDTHTVCPWKGTASYYNVEVSDTSLPDDAWYYPEPKDAASSIKDHIAFWRGVSVEEKA